VEEGAIVKVGDLIAKIKVIPNMINLNNAENRLTSSEIAFDNAEKAFVRDKQLHENEIIALADYQNSELAFNNAAQEVAAAKDNLQIVKEGMTDKEGSVSNTLIRSTKAGTILDIPVEEGNSVIEANNFNDGTTVAMVADLTDMIFEGKVDESEVGKINAGMDILLRIGAIEDEDYHAKLEFISPKGIEENGAIQFLIRAALTLKEGTFVRAGYSANAEIVLDKRDNVLAISESLIEFSGDSIFIEIEKETQVFEKMQIELGISDGINSELLTEIDTSLNIKVPNLKTVSPKR
jgi:HlyD family secretion protein